MSIYQAGVYSAGTYAGVTAVTADVAAIGAMSWSAVAAVNASLIDPAAVQANVAALGAMSWGAVGSGSVIVMDAVAVDVAALGSMAWAAVGAVYVSDGSIVWPTTAASAAHRAVVPFYGVRAIVTAESTEP
jgi:hypothetical protein